MTREQAMRKAAIVANFGFAPDRDDCQIATAGADAERARVVEWLRARAVRTKRWKARVILLWLAREIELGEHWRGE